jgi:hypothetical protein
MRLLSTTAILICSTAVNLIQTSSSLAQDPAQDPVQDIEESSPQTQMSVGVGTVTMDGETFQQVSFRPEIPIGKFGIGLDFTLYFDADGNIRGNGWDEAADIIDKIRYLRYAHPGDPLYFRAGALDDVTIGYGILMKHYANSVEYPAVKRLGLDFEIQRAGFQVEGMFNNFRELTEPGLFAIRVSRPLVGNLSIGAAVVADGNQFANLSDADDDDVPDELDRFPGDDDEQVYEWLQSLYDNFPAAYDGLRGQYPEWPEDPTTATPDYTPGSAPITALSLDVGYPLLFDKLHLYAQGAHFLTHGFGITAPGAVFTPFPSLTVGAEYRYYTDEFLPEYFDRTYELTRSTVVNSNNGRTLASRETTMLDSARAAQGIYASMRFKLLSLLYTELSYSSMHPINEGSSTSSVWGSVGLSMARIPKLTELSAYYYQANAEKMFILEPDALPIWGYRIGYEISSGVNLMLNYRYTYRDLDGDGTISGNAEMVRTFAIETSFVIN